MFLLGADNTPWLTTGMKGNDTSGGGATPLACHGDG